MPSSDHSQGFESLSDVLSRESTAPDSDLLANSMSIAELEQQVAHAQAELEEYQSILNDLPVIYEGKFRQKLHIVAQDIRQLLDERKALRDLVAKALVQARDHSLSPASEEVCMAASASIAVHKKWADLRVSRFQAVAFPFAGFKAKRSPLLFIGIGSAFLVAIVIVGLQVRGNRQIALSPKPVVSAKQPNVLISKAKLKLQANGGKSWVLVEDFNGGTILDVILEPGQSKLLPIKNGLRVRSGRPDLLMIEVDQAPSRPLGKVADMDWFYYRP